jgi:hypothetical protein
MLFIVYNLWPNKYVYLTVEYFTFNLTLYQYIKIHKICLFSIKKEMKYDVKCYLMSNNKKTLQSNPPLP